ncbi:MAG: hypothetical protein U0746_15835 [Gemmataceae bacterium]
MKAETDPITEDEWLLRRVHKDRFPNDKIPPVSPSAFEPRVKGRDLDVDGISLYREACLADATDILATVDQAKRHEQGIVRLPVRALLPLGLSVEIKPDARIKGHVVIPQLNAADYAANKAAFTPTKLALAEIAGENIVLKPRPDNSGVA